MKSSGNIIKIATRDDIFPKTPVTYSIEDPVEYYIRGEKQPKMLWDYGWTEMIAIKDIQQQICLGLPEKIHMAINQKNPYLVLKTGNTVAASEDLAIQEIYFTAIGRTGSKEKALYCFGKTYTDFFVVFHILKEQNEYKCISFILSKNENVLFIKMSSDLNKPIDYFQKSYMAWKLNSSLPEREISKSSKAKI